MYKYASNVSLSIDSQHLSFLSEFCLNDDDYEEISDEDFNDTNADSTDTKKYVDIRERRSKSEKPFASGSDGRFTCACGKSYKEERYLRHHLKWECNKVPAFQCKFCAYSAKRRSSMKAHLSRRHKCNDERSMVINAHYRWLSWAPPRNVWVWLIRIGWPNWVIHFVICGFMTGPVGYALSVVCIMHTNSQHSDILKCPFYLFAAIDCVSFL